MVARRAGISSAQCLGTVALSSSSLILVTPQDHVTGVAVERVVADVAAKRFTIYLTKPVTVSLAIAWFVLG